MTRDEIHQLVQRAVGAVISEALQVSVTPEPNEPLLSSGLIDSVSLVGLIERLSAQLGVEVQVTEVTLDNFDTVARITAFAAQRLGDE